MKRHNKLQSPFTPLILMVIILMGTMMGGGSKDKEDTAVNSSESIVVNENQEIPSTTEPTNKENTSVEKEEQKSDAQLAIEGGIHISSEITDQYAKEVAEKYSNRKVVSCTSTGLVREDEDGIYRQSFEEVTGYMTLVRIDAQQETTLDLEISTELEDVTVILTYPDQSYIVLNQNTQVQCRVPKGASTILYIGEKLSGSIEAKLGENELISSRRM